MEAVEFSPSAPELKMALGSADRVVAGRSPSRTDEMPRLFNPVATVLFETKPGNSNHSVLTVTIRHYRRVFLARVAIQRHHQGNIVRCETGCLEMMTASTTVTHSRSTILSNACELMSCDTFPLLQWVWA